MKKTFYYNDELNDEFFADGISSIMIDGNYKYISNNLFYKIVAFLYYRLIVLPVAWIYCVLIKKIRFENIKNFKRVKKEEGFFVFANHTHNIADAFAPNIICQPKKPYIIVNSKNLNLPLLKGSTKMLGALPLPSNMDAAKNFMSAIQNRLGGGSGIIVYPEAHIWPYYTKIRPYKSTAFVYPVKFNVPSFCFTTTYQKRGRGYKVVIYIDGPFYCDNDLQKKERQEDLRNRIYKTMLERSKNSNYEKNIFLKREGNADD